MAEAAAQAPAGPAGAPAAVPRLEHPLSLLRIAYGL